LFRAGREALQQGDTATACAKFHESYRLEHAVGTILNMAACEEALGELSDAWQHYQDVVHELPENDDRMLIARDRLEQLDQRLPRVTVHLAAGAPEDTRASIGPIELGPASFDTPLPMDPGDYSVRVTAAGMQPRVLDLELREGDRSEITIAPGDVVTELPLLPKPPSLTAAARAPADTNTTARNLRPALGYGLLGAGTASLLVAMVSGVLALDRNGTVQDHCPDKRCDSTGFAAARSAETLAITSVVSAGAGVVAAGAGLYLLLVTPKQNRGFVVRPALSPALLGLHASGQL
jgi:hypothetical protein